MLANLWSSRVLTEQIRKEGWDYNDDMSSEYRAAPLDFEATSLPRSPGEDSRVESDRGPPNGYTRYRTDSFDQPHRDSESYNRARVGEARTRQGSERDNPLRDRLLSDQSLNRAPPAYLSQSSFENAGYDRTPKGKRLEKHSGQGLCINDKMGIFCSRQTLFGDCIHFCNLYLSLINLAKRVLMTDLS